MLTKIFGTRRLKNFDSNMWYAPLLIRKQFSESKTFSKTVGLLHKNFRHCETKNFRRQLVTHPIMHKNFRLPKVSETLTGCPRDFSALWDLNCFDGKLRYTPLFFSKNFSKPGIFSKTVGLLYKFFRQCETNDFLRKIVTPIKCINFFDIRYPPKHWRDAHEFFRHCES